MGRISGVGENKKTERDDDEHVGDGGGVLGNGVHIKKKGPQS